MKQGRNFEMNQSQKGTLPHLGENISNASTEYKKSTFSIRDERNNC